MAAKSGQVASLFSTSGSSTAATGEAMTQDGATFKYYIADRTKSWWDPAHVPVFYDGGVEIAATSIKNIYYAAGFVELTAAAAGAVTCDVYWFVPEALGGVYGFDFQPKAETKDITVMPSVLNSPTYWRSYLKTLMDWQGTAQRHFFTGRASVTMDCTNDNSDLIWTLREWGAPGNLRSVEYLGGTDQTLEVSYNAGTKKFTVQCATTGTSITTTAADIRTHVLADATLSALVELTYPTGKTGAGVVEAKTAALMTGGRDQSTDFAKIGTQVLVRAYLNITTGSLEMVSGLAHLVGLPMNVKLEEVQEADLQFQGIGPLLYHTV